MKKIFKLLGLLLALATVIGFTACDGLFGLGAGTDEDDYSQPINHTFLRAESDVGYFVCHYDAQNTFNYGNHTNCYYQIEFTSSSKSFTLSTRKKGSMEILEKLTSGTYAGDPFKEGVVTLTTVEGKSIFQTITIQKNASGRLFFNGDVSVTHKAIGAHDEK